MSYNWNDFGKRIPRGPLPAGRYIAKLTNAVMTFDQNAVGRSELTFEVLEGDHARRLVWFDYPHKIKDDGYVPFAWAARMVWEATGHSGPPPGDGPQQWFTEIVRALGDRVGCVVSLTLEIETYEWQGEERQKNKVKQIERVGQQQPAQNHAPIGDAPQW